MVLLLLFLLPQLLLLCLLAPLLQLCFLLLLLLLWLQTGRDPPVGCHGIVPPLGCCRVCCCWVASREGHTLRQG
jgi:hypothetical protein